MALDRFALRMTGGPLDGGTYGLEGDEDPSGRIIEVLYEGTHLYRSNGPVGHLDLSMGPVNLDYCGRQFPTNDELRVCLYSW